MKLFIASIILVSSVANAEILKVPCETFNKETLTGISCEKCKTVLISEQEYSKEKAIGQQMLKDHSAGPPPWERAGIKCEGEVVLPPTTRAGFPPGV